MSNVGHLFLYAAGKVLVVDDNRANLMMMEMLLKRSQVHIECADGGNECLQMTKKKKYDLILMDHMMPEPNGIQTLHLLRADKDNANRDTKVIVTTANAISGMEELYLSEGSTATSPNPSCLRRWKNCW